MTQPNRIETSFAPPTDESLVDYLLGESADGDAIERWLASDQSHLLRLEGLAEVVCATGTDAVLVGVRGESVSVARLAEYEPIPMVAGKESRVSARRVLLGLATLAASIALIIVWSQQQKSDQRLTNDRLAVVWADVVSGDDTVNPLTIDFADSWSLDNDVMPGDMVWTTDEAVSGSGQVGSGEFASGDDSPPQWLLVAVSQMTEGSSDDAADRLDSDALNEEEVR
jgi:hypothetical protein